MTGLVLLVVCALAYGLPIARIIDSEIRGASWVGASFLAGSGALALELAILSASGAGWGRSTVLIVMVLAASVLWFLAWKMNRLDLARPQAPGYVLFIDGLTVAVITGHALFATIAPIAESDFMTIWGLKARTFWLAGGIDFSFLTNPWSALFHVDYPILLPLVYDAVAILGGAWDDRLLGAVTTLVGAAALLVVRHEASEATGSSLVSALITLGVSGLLLSPWIGLAEGPLAAYATAGVLIVRRGLATRATRTVSLGAVMVGCGALVKNEGLALVVAVAIGVLIAERSIRWVVALWPAMVIPWIWLIPKAVYGLESDLGSQGVISRIADRLVAPTELLGVIATTNVGRDLMWAGALIAILIVGRRVLASELFTISVIVAQFAAYLIAYMASPHDLVWHVTWSWERLVSHMTPLLIFTITIHLAAVWTGTSRPDREAAE